MKEKLEEHEINSMIDKVNESLNHEYKRRIEICDSIIKDHPWINIRKPTGMPRRWLFDKIGFGHRGTLIYNNIIQHQYSHKTELIKEFFKKLGISK